MNGEPPGPCYRRAETEARQCLGRIHNVIYSAGRTEITPKSIIVVAMLETDRRTSWNHQKRSLRVGTAVGQWVMCVVRV